MPEFTLNILFLTNNGILIAFKMQAIYKCGFNFQDNKSIKKYKLVI